jgi:hypothetical protein
MAEELEEGSHREVYMPYSFTKRVRIAKDDWYRDAILTSTVEVGKNMMYATEKGVYRTSTIRAVTEISEGVHEVRTLNSVYIIEELKPTVVTGESNVRFD